MSFWEASEGARTAAARAQMLVLDIDGVLLDPRPSYYRAALETAHWAAGRGLGRAPSLELDQAAIDAFKAAGGWNDDFDLAVGLAWSLVLHVEGRSQRHPVETAERATGGLGRLAEVAESELDAERFRHLSTIVDTRLVRLRTAARYAGRSRCQAMYGIDPDAHPDLPDEGLWHTEPILCDPRPLQMPYYELACFTGRNGPEAALAFERLEIRIPTERRVVDDGVMPRKPAPDGLVRLAEADLPMLFVGDTIDDQNAANAYRALRPEGPRLTFARVLPADASIADRAEAREAGADFVVSGLDALFAAIADYRKE